MNVLTLSADNIKSNKTRKNRFGSKDPNLFYHKIIERKTRSENSLFCQRPDMALFPSKGWVKSVQPVARNSSIIFHISVSGIESCRDKQGMQRKSVAPRLISFL